MAELDAVTLLIAVETIIFSAWFVLELIRFRWDLHAHRNNKSDRNDQA
jgi:hypothetical protein